MRTVVHAYVVLSLVGCGGRTLDSETDELNQGGVAGRRAMGGSTGTAKTSAIGGAWASYTLASNVPSQGGTEQSTTYKGSTSAAMGGSSYSIPRSSAMGGSSTKSSSSRGGSSSYGGSSNATRGGSSPYGGSSTSGGSVARGGTGSGGTIAIGGGGTRAGSAGNGGSAGRLVGGAAGTLNTAGSAGRPVVSGGTAGSTAGAGAGMAGNAGAAICPPTNCPSAMTCPTGLWAPLSGCANCSCTPPDNQMTYQTISCPANSLVIGTSVTNNVGTGRLELSVDWSCLSITATASVTVAIYYDATHPIDATNRGVFYTAADSTTAFAFIEAPQVTISMSGTILSLSPIPVYGAFVSIRREGNSFVGGLYLPAASSSSGTPFSPSDALLAANFRVPSV